MLKIGWAKREISTNEPVNLFGQMYMRISEGIMDPCYATVMCVDSGEKDGVVFFCSVDLEAMRCDFVEMTQKAVKKRCPEIPVDAIIINATHTHNGGDVSDSPEVTADGMPFYPGRKYREFVTEKCAEAICEAWKNRRESGIAYGFGYAVAEQSRRVVYTEDKSKHSGPNAPNGHCVMNGKTNDPTFSHYEAGADHRLNVMFTFDIEKNLTGIVVNVPCPSQAGDWFTVMTADYWSNVREKVAEVYGPDVYILPQCAAAGDLTPYTYHYRDALMRRFRLKYGSSFTGDTMDIAYSLSMAMRKDICETIMNGIAEVYSWAKKEIQTEVVVRHIGKEIELDRRMITEEEKEWCENNLIRQREKMKNNDSIEPEKRREKLGRQQSFINRNLEMLERFEDQKEHKTVATIIHTVRIGEIAFATNRFEMFMDYMHRIQARSPFIQTFVVQLAGCEGANYLPTERAFANKGYSASLYDNPVSPKGGQQLVEETLKMLHEMVD